MIARLAAQAWVHVAVAFLLMGGWAFFANRGHPIPKPLIAAMTQGALSGAITCALKWALDHLRTRMPRAWGWGLPPLIALGVSLGVLVTTHRLAGTPELWRTIAVPFAVATIYALIYNLIKWTRETP